MQRGSVALLMLLAACSGAARTAKPNREPAEDPERVAAGLRAWRAGDVKTAIAELEAAHARDPQALAVLARAWLQAGDVDKARAVGATALASFEASGARATPRLVADLGEGVEHVAANKDGTLVATTTPSRAGRKPATTIWNTTIGRDVYRLADVQVAAFGDDGALVTGGTDGLIAVREPATGKVIRELAPKIGAPVWIGIAPRDNAIIAIDATSIHEWDAATGRELRAYAAPKRFRPDKSAFALSPDGSMLVGAIRTGEAAGDVCAIWSRRDAPPRATIVKLGKWVVGGLAVARDGRIAIGVRARPLAKIVFVDPQRAKIAGELDVAADVRVLAYAANEDLVAAGRTLQRFHDGSAKPAQDTPLAHEVGRGRGVFVADAGVLIAVHDSVASIATATGTAWAAAGRAEAVHSLAWSPDGAHLAVGGASPQVAVWDVARGGAPKTYDAGAPVSAVAIDRDGRVAASLHDANSRVIVWNASGVREREIAARELGSLSFDGGGGVAGRELDNPYVVHAWSASGDAIDASARAVPGRTFAVSPDGMRIAEASHDRIVIRALDPSGKVVGVVRVGDEPTAVAWGAHALATAHPDGRIACYNHDTGDVVRTLSDPGTAGVVTYLAFRPDGRTLAVGRLDGVVDLWDMPSQSRIAQLASAGGGRWLAIAADGSVDGALGAASTLTWEVPGVTLPWVAAWNRRNKPGLVAAVVAAPPPPLAIAPVRLPIEPPPSCLPLHDIGPPLVSATSGDGGNVSACWLREPDHAALCFEIEPASGRITPVAPDLETQAAAGHWGRASPEPIAAPATWDDDHAEAKVCAVDGSSCRTFRGTDVAVTSDRALVAVRTDAQHVEIWELASGKRLARHVIPQRADAHSTIGFWSRTLLVSADSCAGPCETSIAYDTRTGRRLGHVGSAEHPANTSEFAPVLLHDDVWAFHEDHGGGAIVIQDATTARLIGRVAAKQLAVDPKELRGPTYELRAARDGGVVIVGSGKLAGRVWTVDRRAAVSHAWRVPACATN
jgi:WD40 repeat protein